MLARQSILDLARIYRLPRSREEVVEPSTPRRPTVDLRVNFKPGLVLAQPQWQVQVNVPAHPTGRSAATQIVNKPFALTCTLYRYNLSLPSPNTISHGHCCYDRLAVAVNIHNPRNHGRQVHRPFCKIRN